jgi:transcriptional regulator with XRE-family HTH domain
MARTEINPAALRALRERSGLTQKALADAAGISFQYVNDLESGHRAGQRPALRNALAEALNVPVTAIETSAAQEVAAS